MKRYRYLNQNRDQITTHVTDDSSRVILKGRVFENIRNIEEVPHEKATRRLSIDPAHESAFSLTHTVQNHKEDIMRFKREKTMKHALHRDLKLADRSKEAYSKRLKNYSNETEINQNLVSSRHSTFPQSADHWGSMPGSYRQNLNTDNQKYIDSYSKKQSVIKSKESRINPLYSHTLPWLQDQLKINQKTRLPILNSTKFPNRNKNRHVPIETFPRSNTEFLPPLYRQYTSFLLHKKKTGLFQSKLERLPEDDINMEKCRYLRIHEN